MFFTPLNQKKVLNGKITSYRKGGQKHTEIDYNNGSYDGNKLFFYRSGMLAHGECFKKSKPHGEELIFSKHQPHSPILHQFYRNGKCINNLIRKEMGMNISVDYVLTNEERLIISLRYSIPLVRWELPEKKEEQNEGFT